MTTIALALQAVKERIQACAKAAGRTPHEIQLVAVSKGFAPCKIEEAYRAGQTSFGENRAQEGLEKIHALKHLSLDWHFIGPIQSNKTRLVAEHFSWVHTIERSKIAERLSLARSNGQAPLQVCIQVNISGEGSKSGVSPGDLLPLAKFVQTLPRLRLRGLMAIPQLTADFDLQRRQFRQLRELKAALAVEGISLDTLSMGMSHDLEAAIWEGATMLRVGTAIFGDRKSTKDSWQ
ncbi:MAG TPA: YggS family pyridoxal phosphate-dependent enzyme [Burkholderiales bacterium]|nr:YggS family pyridoxal phosphate-dependent enzyme [Burkholderiales bacterium]